MNCESEVKNRGEEYVRNESILRSVIFGLLLLTPIISPGSIGAFTSVCLPQMKLNLDTESWFASIVAITVPLGALSVGLLIDKYGRRVSILVSIIPNTIGYFLLADTNSSPAQLYLSRFLSGFALGSCRLPSVIYLAECITVDHVRIRSSVGTMANLAMATGGLLVYTLSIFLPYDRIALVLGSLSTLSLFLILIFLPESPAWLCQQGRFDEAGLAWRRLGTKRPILQNHAISTTVPAVTTGSPIDWSPPPNRPFLKRVVVMVRYVNQTRRREVYIPLVITIGFQFFCQFSGINCVVSFMIELITVRGLNVSPYTLSLIGQALQIVGCLLTSSTLPALGTRVLSIISFSVISSGYMALALSMLYENSSTHNIFSYLHVAAIWTIMLAATGVLGISSAITGELFPMGAKGLASLPTLAASVFGFIVLKIFPFMWAQYEGLVFIVFGAICACGSVFVLICLPETVGKTVDEITQSFQESDANNTNKNNVDESVAPLLANRYYLYTCENSQNVDL